MSVALRWVAGLLVIAACGTTSVVPITAGDLEAGKEVFVASCAECHGANAEGTDLGPPLVDNIYRPSHHSDDAFLIAVRRGVPAHHWNFGPMLAVEGLTDDDIADLIAYVRGLQQAAGIE